MNRQRVPFEEGPYLTAAFLCERVLDEKDNVKSAIRIVDRVTRTTAVQDPTQQMEPFDYEMTLFISFKSGWARGPLPLRLVVAKPSGDSVVALDVTMHFEGEEDRGVNVVLPMQMNFDQTGIYWVDVELNEIRVTRIPFRVIYNPIVRRRSTP